jgi:hypothetical protein
MKLFKAAALVVGGILPFVAMAAPASADTFNWALGDAPAVSSGGFAFTGSGSLTATPETGPGTVPGEELVTSLTGTINGKSVSLLAVNNPILGNDNLIFINTVGNSLLDAFGGLGIAIATSSTTITDIVIYSAEGVGNPAGSNGYDEQEIVNGTAANEGAGNFATPLPAALPLYAAGVGVVGFFARRKKRNAQQAA